MKKKILVTQGLYANMPKGKSNEFKQYRRKGLAEMRPYVPGEDLLGVSVSEADTRRMILA
jgi:hypothetical protein